MRALISVATLLFILLPALSMHSQAAAYEKYLLAVPLQPANAEAKQNRWFGKGIRFAIEETVLSLTTLVFIKDDELESLGKEYRFKDRDPEPGQMEKVADDKDIAILYGTYRMQGDKIDLVLSLIPGRNFEARTFKVSGSANRLDNLFSNMMRKVSEILDLTIREEDRKVFNAMPGTASLDAFSYYYQACELLKPNPESDKNCLQAIPLFTEALKKDAGFLPARAGRARCRIQLAQAGSKKATPKFLSLAKQDIDKAMKTDPVHPLLMNAQIAYLMTFKKYAEARTLSEKNLALHPANYENYLLLGKIHRALKEFDQSEKILLKGLDQQGTAIQKKPFHRELGLLLLKKKDDHAEVYLKEVLALEPANYRLYYLRATALFRLKRYLDVMTEIQKAEVLKNWRDLQLLKAETALALGNVFYEEGDYDRAFSYASIAVNLRERHFETLLLMAKVLRKKGFQAEAKKQIEAARTLARKKHPKDHLWLGTEFVAQGMKSQGAEEYVLYLKLNPKAPERRRLISLIRKLQGDVDE